MCVRQRGEEGDRKLCKEIMTEKIPHLITESIYIRTLVNPKQYKHTKKSHQNISYQIPEKQ